MMDSIELCVHNAMVNHVSSYGKYVALYGCCRPEEKTLEKRKCKYCGKEFVPKRKNHIYCSLFCQEQGGRLARREKK